MLNDFLQDAGAAEGSDISINCDSADSTVKCLIFKMCAPLERRCFCDVYFLPRGARSPQAWWYWLCKSSIAATKGLTGLLTAAQNKTEWIISNTAKSNSTNLSFPSLGSHFALMEERKESKKGGEEREERQLETCAYISKAETVCQRSCARCSALLMQNCSVFCLNLWLTKHFRLVIVMHSLRLFFLSLSYLL